MKRLHFFLGILCATLLFPITCASAATPVAPEYVKLAWIDNTGEYLVRWLPVEGATGYNVYYYEPTPATWSRVATNRTFNPWSVLSFRHAHPGGGSATYAVSAVNADGEGPATSVSFEPGAPVGGSFYVGYDWWPKGYTFIDPSFSYDMYDDGTDGMVELGVSETNFTHGAWHTNIDWGHALHVTNLSPGTVWVTRLTMVKSNGMGVSFVYPANGTYTLPVTPYDVWEDTENSIFVGDYTWAAPGQLFSQALHGTVIPGLYPWEWKYIPEPNFTGIDTFEILDNPDGPPVTLTLNVQNVNDPPVTDPLTVYVAEDTPTVITPTATDLENDPFTFWIYDQPSNGYLLWQGSNFVYYPNTDFVGTDQFTFFAMDENWMGTALGTIIVTNVNDAPVATNQLFSMLEEMSITFEIDGADIDGDALTLEIVNPPLHGSLATNGLTVTYTPNANYWGGDYFTYRVSDGQSTSEVANVDFSIDPVNDAPVAQDKSVGTDEDVAVNVVLTGIDVDEEPLTFEVVDPPQHGTFVNGVYTPAPNYYGADSFTYRANDGQLNSAVATVAITVNAVNDAPVADSKSVATAEDQSVAVTLTGSDLDGNPLTFSVVTAPAHGTFVNDIYTPAANYFGSDSFTYKANDGQSDSAVATVSITVAPVNDAPVANAQSVSTAYNTAKNITLTGSDVEGSALTFTVVTSPANGTLTGTGATRTFTPNTGWYGTTSFTFKVNDGALDSATATVTVTVAAPTGIPTAPTALTATAVSQTQVNLAWTDNSNNEDGFKIERSPNGSSSWIQIATVGPNVRNYSNTGLTKNTRYYYRVRAYNVLGNSAYSNTVNARTLN